MQVIDKHLPIGTKVRVVSFHGTLRATEGVQPKEDYWKVVGCVGEVVDERQYGHPAFQSRGPQALIRFELSLDELGVMNPNGIGNSLWTFLLDLEAAVSS